LFRFSTDDTCPPWSVMIPTFDHAKPAFDGYRRPCLARTCLSLAPLLPQIGLFNTKPVQRLENKFQAHPEPAAYRSVRGGHNAKLVNPTEMESRLCIWYL
jgi:hypothetical protein